MRERTSAWCTSWSIIDHFTVPLVASGHQCRGNFTRTPATPKVSQGNGYRPQPENLAAPSCGRRRFPVRGTAPLEVSRPRTGATGSASLRSPPVERAVRTRHPLQRGGPRASGELVTVESGRDLRPEAALPDATRAVQDGRVPADQAVQQVLGSSRPGLQRLGHRPHPDACHVDFSRPRGREGAHLESSYHRDVVRAGSRCRRKHFCARHRRVDQVGHRRVQVAEVGELLGLRCLRAPMGECGELVCSSPFRRFLRCGLARLPSTRHVLAPVDVDHSHESPVALGGIDLRLVLGDGESPAVPGAILWRAMRPTATRNPCTGRARGEAVVVIEEFSCSVPPVGLEPTLQRF